MKALHNIFVLLFLSNVCHVVLNSRILCVFQTGIPSHQQTFKSLVKVLSLRGHEVISVTPSPIRDPSLDNLTEIDISNIDYANILGPKFEFHWSKELYIHTKIRKIWSIFNDIGEAILQCDQFKKIYQDKKQKFDLIIVQTYVNPALYALSAKLNAPIIGVSSMGLWAGSHVAAGNPNPPSIYSEMYVSYNGNLCFWERIQSALYYLWHRYFVYFDGMPMADQMVRKYLGFDIPYLEDIQRNVSVLFMNVNPILYPVRPLVPTTIELSFLHIQPPKPLPEDLKKEIESAKNGVVYFSLGSTITTSHIEAHIIGLFIKAMADLPYKVLWKYENEQYKVPKNVVIRKWFPQQDILAHPNVKIFVSQCGLQSFEEVVDRGVPMVCIPFISDQAMNSRKLAELGVIREIDYLNATKDEMVQKITEVATNPIYRQRMRELKNLLQDEPMSGAQKVIWWSEYVIRHKGSRHLHSPTADIEWYKFLLLDVFGVLVVIPILILSLILLKIKKLFCKAEEKLKKN